MKQVGEDLIRRAVSRAPNMQQIPREKSPEYLAIREAYLEHTGHPTWGPVPKEDD